MGQRRQSAAGRYSRAAEIIVLLALIAGSHATACACSCGGAGPCNAYRRFGTLVLATVLRIEVRDNEHPQQDGSVMFGGGYRIVTLSVLEDFSGDFRVGQQLEVRTGMGGGDCGFPFHEGERYLVDMSRRDGQLSTGICSDTSTEAYAGPKLRELRARAAQQPPPDLRGVLVHAYAPRSSDGPSSTILPHVAITITGLDGSVLRTETGADGVYEVAHLVPSVYAVQPELPKGLMLLSQPAPIVVPWSNATGAGCLLNLNAYTVGRITGQVLDPEGHATQGWVSVYSATPHESAGRVYVTSDSMSPDGSFTLAPLEPGTYWIAFEATDRRRVWYPGTADPAHAAALALSEGLELGGLRFIVPARAAASAPAPLP